MHKLMNRKAHARHALSIGCAFLLSMGLTARGGELNPKHVPADAKWMIHVDYEGLSGSALWQKLRSEKLGDSQAQGSDDQRGAMIGYMVHGWMKERYGIDLPEDLNSITMFSRDYKAYTGTVIVQADYDPGKIEARVKEADNHRTTKWQDLTLHTVTLSKQKKGDKGPSGDEEMTVVMVDENTLLLASSVDNAKSMLKLFDGDGKSLAEQDSPLLSDQAKNAWIYGAAIDLKQLRQHPAAMPILTQHQRIHWSIGKQSDGRLYEQAEFVAESPEVAQKMKKVIDGVVAYQTLWADGSEALTEIAKNTKVKNDGATTSFVWEGSQEQVLAAIEDLFARLNGWKEEKSSST